MRMRKGFTILEVVAAVAILSVGMMALSHLQNMSIQHNNASHRATIATILAQDKLEELRSLSWDDDQLSDETDNYMGGFDWGSPDHTNVDGREGIANPIDEHGYNVPDTESAPSYQRFWCVEDDMPGTNMKMVSVQIQWTEYGRDRTVTLDTIISKE